ncbi:MAG: hypothetical protein ACRD24_15390, partial [Terriglobales bacterium]
MFGGMALGSRAFASAQQGVISDAIVITVSGVDETSRLDLPSLRVQERLNGRMTASLGFFEQRPSSWRPIIGAPVTIFLGSTRRFAGTIDELGEVMLQEHEDSMSHMAVECVDWNQIPQRF